MARGMLTPPAMAESTDEVSLIQRVALAYAELVHGRTRDTAPLEKAVRGYASWLRDQKARPETVSKLVAQALNSPLSEYAGTLTDRRRFEDSARQWAISEYYAQARE